MKFKSKLSAQSTYIYVEITPSPGTGEGGLTRLRVRGMGSPNSDDWKQSLALCDFQYTFSLQCVCMYISVGILYLIFHPPPYPPALNNVDPKSAGEPSR
jgi:hypothetical protein